MTGAGAATGPACVEDDRSRARIPRARSRRQPGDIAGPARPPPPCARAAADPGSRRAIHPQRSIHPWLVARSSSPCSSRPAWPQRCRPADSGCSTGRLRASSIVAGRHRPDRARREGARGRAEQRRADHRARRRTIGCAAVPRGHRDVHARAGGRARRPDVLSVARTPAICRSASSTGPGLISRAAIRLDSANYGICITWAYCVSCTATSRVRRGTFASAQPLAPDGGELAGSTDWLWMSLQRAGRGAEAQAMLARRPDSLPRHGYAYVQRLRLYRGEIGPDAVLTPADTADVQVATLELRRGQLVSRPRRHGPRARRGSSARSRRAAGRRSASSRARRSCGGGSVRQALGEGAARGAVARRSHAKSRRRGAIARWYHAEHAESAENGNSIGSAFLRVLGSA